MYTTPQTGTRPGLDQAAIRATVRDFVEREIPPDRARAIDQNDEYPSDLLDKFGQTGLWGINIAEEYGGLGGCPVDALPIYEELSRRLPVLAWVIGNILLYGNDIIGKSGSPEQKEYYLPRLAQGELRFSFALTEPNAGSDAAKISTKATFREGHYLITGSKMFITGAGVSDVVVTMTRTAPSKYRGITAFLVPTATPGYSTSHLKKLGYQGSDTCAVHYEDVQVTPSHILGGESCLNQGWGQMVKLLNSERLALASCSLGIGQAVLDETIAYAKERFHLAQGRWQHQAIRHALVDMATELEAARHLTYHAARLEGAGIECVRETSMAKYFASETAKKIALQGVEILGRDGATLAFDCQRALRDVLVLSIGGGTTQIQKNIVARQMGL
ncbi:MAG: acyl-CoA dehydrogenase [Chloroflexi bacterium]|nr:acyl-CoA dehydrogenase [Chloroflexota bacterium]